MICRIVNMWKILLDRWGNMDLFRKRRSIDDNLEYDRQENKIKARKIDNIYKIGACVLGLLWVISLFKPFNFKFNIKDLMNIKYMFYEKRGNTLGNDVNRGLAVKYKDYTYYVNLEDDNKIYRVKKGSSVREKVLDDSAHELSVVGNELYYINESDEGKIYKLNIKSNEKKKIIDETATQMQISGGHIYYLKSLSKLVYTSKNQNQINLDNELYKIFKIKLDGSGRKKVAEDTCGRFVVYNGWIYYSNPAKNGLLYRMTRDGTNNTKLSKDSAWDFWMDDEFIYYVNNSNRNGTASLARIKHDGSEEVEFYNRYVQSMNIVGDTIYLTSEVGLCKMNREDKKIEVIVPNSNMGSYQYISVVNDYIYYGGMYGSLMGGLSRIKTTGKDMESEPEIPKEIFVKGIKGEADNYYGKTLAMFNNRGIYKNKDYIYYQKQGMLNRLNMIDGEKKTIMSNATAGSTDFSGDYIFYINYEDFGKIYMMKENGTDNKLFFNEKVADFIISGDYIYYKKVKDNGRGIYRIKLDGTEDKKILGDNQDYINTVIIQKDFIYYDKNGRLYRSGLDGKNEVQISDIGSDRFKIAGNYLYCSIGGLYSINIETKEIKKIFDKECFPIQVDGDYIYIVNFGEEGLFRIKNDGSSAVKISDEHSYSLVSVGKFLYYNSSDGTTLYRFNTENGETLDVSQGILK